MCHAFHLSTVQINVRFMIARCLG
uniref:Uncharacterized protein n=1 Tax=Rhizophora mucronata TaxID=61149 RepID=A0A2P2PYX1_RHIMU